MQEYLYNLATDKYQGFMSDTIKFFLLILSLIYGLVVRIVILFSHFGCFHLNCKVISVGNITLGGTGKTSLVEYIARYLKQQGHKVAILSRGYKRNITSYDLRVTSYESMGDESYMLSKNLGNIPVIVDANRIRAANLAIRKYGVDTVILDDGFQQWRIWKDLEIVTINSTNPFGNGYLLPRGILREPLSYLKRADVFVLTKTNLNPDILLRQGFAGLSSEAKGESTLAKGDYPPKASAKADIQDIKDFLCSINTSAAIFESIHKPLGFYKIDNNELFNTNQLGGKTVTLISGIGDPDSFENLVISLGIKIGLSFRFGDHHNYTIEDLDRIVSSSKNKNIDTLITTEKDAVRVKNLPLTTHHLPLLVLHIAQEIKDEERFHNRLHRLYSV